jgi:hypothetical protein
VTYNTRAEAYGSVFGGNINYALDFFVVKLIFPEADATGDCNSATLSFSGTTQAVQVLDVGASATLPF